MKERERIVVSGAVCVLLLGWLGFLLHRSPRFPGSGVGAVFGIAGAALMPNAAKRHMSSDAERRRRETTALDKSRPVV